VTTQWACAHKAEQRSLARRARCNRVHSAVTYLVNVIKAEKFNIHTAFLMFASGQLRFLGLSPQALAAVGRMAEVPAADGVGKIQRRLRQLVQQAGEVDALALPLSGQI
jgi:hypothetical protein